MVCFINENKNNEKNLWSRKNQSIHNVIKIVSLYKIWRFTLIGKLKSIGN
jgi:hypothetical protein